MLLLLVGPDPVDRTRSADCNYHTDLANTSCHTGSAGWSCHANFAGNNVTSANPDYGIHFTSSAGYHTNPTVLVNSNCFYSEKNMLSKGYNIDIGLLMLM